MLDEASDLLHQGIGSEIAVDLIHRLEAVRAMLDTLENALRGSDYVQRLAVVRFREFQLARLERAGHFRSFVGQLEDILIEIRETGFKLFNLDEQFGEILIALCRGLAQIQVIGERLVEQAGLRCELGGGLVAAQFLALLLECRPGLVQHRVYGRDILDNARDLGRIVDLQIADHFDQHFEVLCESIGLGFYLLRVGDLSEFFDRAQQPLDARSIGIQGSFGEQKLNRQRGELLQVFRDFLLGCINLRNIRVAQILE